MIPGVSTIEMIRALQSGHCAFALQNDMPSVFGPPVLMENPNVIAELCDQALNIKAILQEGILYMDLGDEPHHPLRRFTGAMMRLLFVTDPLERRKEWRASFDAGPFAGFSTDDNEEIPEREFIEEIANG